MTNEAVPCKHRLFPPARSCPPLRTLLVLIALSVLLGGCFTPAERTSLPVELPEQFSFQGELEPQQRWWLDFQDADLDNLIAAALGDNFTLLAARDRIAEARAVAIQAGASLYPTLDGIGSAESSRNYETDTSSESYYLGLAAAYEIDLWGRLGATEDAALTALQATEADYQSAAITLAAEVATTWYTLIENELQMELLKMQQETNDKVLQVITAQFRSGKAGIADVLQQRQLVESGNGDLAVLQSAQQLLRHQLTILLAIPADSKLPKAPGLAKLPELPKTGIPAELITRRPDVTSSYYSLQAADYQVAAAVADRFPRLSISADLYTSGDSTGDIFNNWFSSLGANLFGPIFDGGRRVAEVERTEAVARQLYYSYGQTILEAIVEVENALVRERQRRLVIASKEIQLKLAAESIVHVGNRYRQGAEDYQRVLLALLSHQNLQRDILVSRLLLINDRIALYRAISGPLASEQSPEEIEAERLKADPRIQ